VIGTASGGPDLTCHLWTVAGLLLLRHAPSVPGRLARRLTLGG